MLCPRQAHPPCPSDTHRSPAPVVPDGVWPTVAGLSESIPDSQAMLCPPQAHPLHPSDTHWSPAPVVPDETQPTFAGLPVPIPALPSPVHQTRTLLHLAVSIRGPSVRYSSVPSSRSSRWDTTHCCRTCWVHSRLPDHAVPMPGPPSLSLRYSLVPSARSSRWSMTHCCRTFWVHPRLPGHAMPTPGSPSPSLRYSLVPSSRSSRWDTAHFCRAPCPYSSPTLTWHDPLLQDLLSPLQTPRPCCAHARPTLPVPQILTGPQCP